MIGGLYSLLLAHSVDDTVRARFGGWLAHRESVHGALERKRSVDRGRLAARYGLEPGSLRLPELLYATETYYVLCMKLRAWSLLSRQSRIGAPERALPRDADGLRRFLARLLSCRFFEAFGLRNYDGGHLFDWFVGAATDEQLLAMRDDCLRLCAQQPVPHTPCVRDTLRAVYHDLLPKQVRHSLGAHYTPDWLAEYVLETVAYGRDERLWAARLLDPTCGSGAFLIAALNARWRAAGAAGMSPAEVLSLALTGVVGFDVDPVAVLAAKTNLVFFICGLLAAGAVMPSGGLPLPIYLCDSIDPPGAPTTVDGAADPRRARLALRLGERSFALPASLVTSRGWRAFVDGLAALAERADGEAGRGINSALAQARRVAPDAQIDESALAPLFRWLCRRHRDGLLRFDAQLLRDAPQPLVQGRFDVVVGNPPWVNWEYLPPAYRERVQHLWSDLGLFDAAGRERAFSKEDISALVAYVACDRYLARGGRLGFVMPQSLFKSSLNAKGFRRLRLAGGEPLGVCRVDDLVAIHPFDGVDNRTAVVFLRKGERTTFPVPYRKWRADGPGDSISMSDTWSEAQDRISIAEHSAMPADAADPASYWVDGPNEALTVLGRLSGACPYRARTGFFTGGANGVYYLEYLEALPDGRLRVRNLTERAKRRVDCVEATIEDCYVFPLLRGRDVDRWRYGTPALTLCPHTPETKMCPVAPPDLRAQAPLTYRYLERFRSALEARRGFSGWERRFLEEAFYACQRIGAYTFAPYKVVWRYIAPDFRCCVVEPQRRADGSARPVLPHEKLMLLGFADAMEAYYLCAVLSSSPVRFFVESRMVETQIAPHVIAQLGLPPFDRGNPAHVAIAQACRAGHRARAAGDEAAYRRRLRHVDHLIGAVLPLDARDVAVMQDALAQRGRATVLGSPGRDDLSDGAPAGRQHQELGPNLAGPSSAPSTPQSGPAATG